MGLLESFPRGSPGINSFSPAGKTQLLILSGCPVRNPEKQLTILTRAAALLTD
jgi:hypothetical protein